MRIRATTLFLALAFAATLPGCGSNGAATSALEAQVVPVEAVKVMTDSPTLPRTIAVVWHVSCTSGREFP